MHTEAAEADIYDQYYRQRPHAVPVLPPVIEGRTYFNKARERERAMKEGRASEPLGVGAMLLKKIVVPAFQRRLIFHWKGTYCDKKISDPKYRERVLDGVAFDAKPREQKCVNCLGQFLKG